MEAQYFGEKVHDALVELSGGSAVFTGCNESGKPLKGHSHAYILSRADRMHDFERSAGGLAGVSVPKAQWRGKKGGRRHRL
jgi:hypothetical protein